MGFLDSIVSDVIKNLNFLFNGAAEPPAPYPVPGVDLTPSPDLGCAVGIAAR